MLLRVPLLTANVLLPVLPALSVLPVIGRTAPQANGRWRYSPGNPHWLSLRCLPGRREATSFRVAGAARVSRDGISIRLLSSRTPKAIRDLFPYRKVPSFDRLRMRNRLAIFRDDSACSEIQTVVRTFAVYPHPRPGAAQSRGPGAQSDCLRNTPLGSGSPVGRPEMWCMTQTPPPEFQTTAIVPPCAAREV